MLNEGQSICDKGCFVIFVTAGCLLLLLKLKWTENKALSKRSRK